MMFVSDAAGVGERFADRFADRVVPEGIRRDVGAEVLSEKGFAVAAGGVKAEAAQIGASLGGSVMLERTGQHLRHQIAEGVLPVVEKDVRPVEVRLGGLDVQIESVGRISEEVLPGFAGQTVDFRHGNRMLASRIEKFAHEPVPGRKRQQLIGGSPADLPEDLLL